MITLSLYKCLWKVILCNVNYLCPLVVGHKANMQDH